MRRLILAATAAATLLSASALAAPTCQDQNGNTIKCGTVGAMPVGWTLSPQQRLDRQMSRPTGPSMNELLELLCALGVFFGLMALLPEFDGWADGDGDAKGRDDQRTG